MKFTFEVPNQLILDALETARCTYWGTISKLHIDDFGRIYVTVLESIDGSEPITHIKDDNDVMRALEAAVLHCPVTFGRLITGQSDGLDGDTLLQFICFGELKYG